MPTYVYRCKKCRHRFELFHSIADESVKRCPRCHAKAERVPAGGAGILFKGAGFYITDYRSKSYREKAKQEKSGPATGSPKPPSTPAPSGGTSTGSGGGAGGASTGSGGGASSKES